MTNYNLNPERIILRGRQLPALLLGSNFIDLRQTAELCQEHDLPIEFYQERNSSGRERSRFFVGRDYSQSSSLDSERDHRIELCQSLPDELGRMRGEELISALRELERNEKMVGGRWHYNGNIGNDIPTIPNFRVYQFETRPPFETRLVGNSYGRNPTAQGLADLLIRYVRFQGVEDDLPMGIIRRSQCNRPLEEV